MSNRYISGVAWVLGGLLLVASVDGAESPEARLAALVARTTEGTAEARAEAWTEVARFIAEHLRDGSGALPEAFLRAVDPAVAALTDPSPAVCIQAAHVLGHVGDARAVGPLLAATKRPDAERRWSAAMALATVLRRCGGSEEAVDGLMALAEDPDERVRRAAASALAQVPSPRVLAFLLDRVARGPDRATALDALGARDAWLDDGRVKRAVVAATKDADAAVRAAGVRLVARMGGLRAAPALLKMMGDPADEVRRAAVEALSCPGLASTHHPVDAADARCAAAMAAALGDVAWHDVALEDVLAFLTSGGASVVPVWERLAEAGVARGAKVTVTPGDVPRGVALWMALRAADASGRAAWKIEKGVVVVSTIEDLEGRGPPAAPRPASGPAPAPAAGAPDVAAKLRLPVPLAVADVPLAYVLRYLGEFLDCDVHPAWPALEAAGVGRTRPVTLKLNRVPAKDAFDLVLRSVAADKVASWRVHEGVVVVATAEGHARVEALLAAWRSAPAKTDADRKVAVALAQPREMALAGVGLGDVLAYVRDATACPVTVDWPALEAAGVARETPVSVRVRHAPLGVALALVLADLDPTGSVTLAVRDGALHVGGR